MRPSVRESASAFLASRNPVVAVLVGGLFGGEAVSRQEVGAIEVTIVAVFFITSARVESVAEPATAGSPFSIEAGQRCE